MRLAGPDQIPWEEGTEILNMSATGLAFTAPSDLCPVVGEVVKVQFDVPGSSGMAAYALVTRVEPNTRSRSSSSQSTMLVATQFIQLDTPQKLHLAHGLGKKLRDALPDPNELLIPPKGRKRWMAYLGFGFVLLLLWIGLFLLIYNPEKF